jgi:hypothetical protein
VSLLIYDLRSVNGNPLESRGAFSDFRLCTWAERIGRLVEATARNPGAATSSHADYFMMLTSSGCG